MILNNMPYVLCEVANVHGGNVEHMRELIREYSRISYEKKGIKFQVFKYDKISLSDYEWYEVYRELYFSPEVWKEFICQAYKEGDVWLDIFDIYGVKVFEDNLSYVSGIKLQASVLDNKEVYEELYKLNFNNKKIIINISGYGLDEIASYINNFKKLSMNLILQIGYQRYPTEVSDTALQKILVLKAFFPDMEICIADHADAKTEFAARVPIYGVILGCKYIEKHICLSAEKSKYDRFSALNILEMQKLCDGIKDFKCASTGDFVPKQEMAYLQSSIQIPVMKHNIMAGTLLSSTDFNYRRTAQQGMTAAEVSEIQSNRCVLIEPLKENQAVNKENFKPAKIAVIVACRMKSTRLPRKAILPIAGVASVERCLTQCTGIKGIDQIILATSNLPEDRILNNYRLSEKVDIWFGEPDDVITRYVDACEFHGIDVVVRITADCPLILPEIIEFLLERHFSAGADYTAPKECAIGTSGEIINVSALKLVKKYFGNAEFSEYMTWYFQNNADFFKVNLVDLPRELNRSYRITLDYVEDLQMFEKLFEHCGPELTVKPANEVFDLLDKNTAISEINSHLTLKYKTDQELIQLLNDKTRMILG